MEIPVINRISDFESGITSLQSQSLLPISGIDKISKVYSIWKWGALLLALLASFSAIIRRIKILVVKLQNGGAASVREPLIRTVDDGDAVDCSRSLSSASSEDDEEDSDGREQIEPSPVEDPRKGDEIFKVKGAGFDFLESPWQSRSSSSSGLRRRRSIGDHFSEFASGKSVVKLWDNLGLGIGLELDGDDSISWDTNWFRPSSSMSRPNLIVGNASATELGFWDTRVASRRPAILAEWGPLVGDACAVGHGGAGKVYLRRGSGELAAVGDLRKVKSPLDNVTDADVETWWDADAVIVNDELIGGGSVRDIRPGSAVTRCCDAVRSYLSF